MAARIKSVQNDINGINFVAGLADPGEMIRCGYLPEIRRRDGEQDDEYADRIRPIVTKLPKKERDLILTAAIKRAGLDASNGKVAVMVAGEPAWHGLGINIEDACGSDEARRLAGLDWTNDAWPLSRWHPEDPDAAGLDVGGWVARVRSDTGAMLGVTSTQWAPLQNAEMFEFMDAVSKGGACKWETAGALNGGKRVWGLARLGDMFDVIPGDPHKAYGLIIQGHAGDLAITVGAIDDRVVCGNTARQALIKKGNGFLKIRHSKGSLKDKIDEARIKLGLAHEAVGKRADQYRQLVKVDMKPAQVREYFEEFYPTVVKPHVPANVDGSSLLDTILDAKGQQQGVVSELLAGHYAESERQAARNAKILEQLLANFEDKTNTLPGMAGTAYAAFNAITEYTDHQQKHRSADTRFSSVLLGTGDALKQQAFASAMQLAK
jgi:phage/plasmid-like protein (TIGR03299 family)